MTVHQLAAMKVDYWDSMMVGKMAARRAAY